MKNYFFATIVIFVFCLFVPSCTKDKECPSCQIPEICINGVCETRPEWFKLNGNFLGKAVGTSLGIPNPKYNWCLDTMVMRWPYGDSLINKYSRFDLFVKGGYKVNLNVSPFYLGTIDTNTYRLGCLEVICTDDSGKECYLLIDCVPSPDSINTTFYIVPFGDDTNLSNSTNITFYNFK